MNQIFSVVIFMHVVVALRENGTTYKTRPSYVAGLFKEKKEAMDVIINNHCDLSEDNYYPYALVEKVNFGLYGVGAEKPELSQVWFKWDVEEEKYKQVNEKPDDLKIIAQFTLM